jgi:hypothetical protein
VLWMVFLSLSSFLSSILSSNFTAVPKLHLLEKSFCTSNSILIERRCVCWHIQGTKNKWCDEHFIIHFIKRYCARRMLLCSLLKEINTGVCYYKYNFFKCVWGCWLLLEIVNCSFVTLMLIQHTTYQTGKKKLN